MPFPKTNLSNYTYNLPEEKIAFNPVSKRENSKLLHYDGKEIKSKSFRDIVEVLLPSDCLFFNNAKVIPARIHVQKETGAFIEIFLLEPVNKDYGSMYFKEKTTWKCLVGNKKRWKDGKLTIVLKDYKVTLSWVNREEGEIEFSWNKDIPFIDVVNEAGEIPLPPYIKRDIEKKDSVTYQTVYAKEEGAVAAPTAGLHFTEEILRNLTLKGVRQQEITLFVGAGTFKPVTEEDVSQHDMHSEKFSISKNALSALLVQEGRKVAVGTTSMRVLESIYWMGVKLNIGKENPFYLGKEEVYILPNLEVEIALNTILEYMIEKELNTLSAETGIFIVPGYSFKMVNVLITNFHQPGSTLIMLVAAFVGQDWKKIYNYALDNNFRFLSYGDSSILERK